MGENGQLSDEAKEIIKVYEDLTPTGDTTIEDAEVMIVRKERWDVIGEAMDTLSFAVNTGDPETVARAMFIAVHKDHRTLQAQVVASMLKFLSIYSGASYDLRNEAAVRAAGKVAQFIKDEGIYIPLI